MSGVNTVVAMSSIPWELMVAIIGVGITSLCALGGVVVFALTKGKEQGEIVTRLKGAEGDIDDLSSKCDTCGDQRKKIEGELFNLNRENIAALASIQASVSHISKQVDHIQNRVDTALNGGGFAKA